VTAAAHARYRTRLAALCDDEALGLAGGGGRLEREYARFHPHRQPFATLVLRDVLEPVLRVEAFDERPAGEGVVQSEAGWLRVSPFGSDPALRGLPELLARPGRRAVVRYRPYRRCTVRFDRSYAKVFADRRGERIAAEGRMLCAAAERGELGFAVARPQRYDTASRTLWQSPVPGRQPERVPARRIGRALASLASASLEPRRVLGPEAPLARSARLGRRLARSVPGVAPDVDRLLARLRRAHSAAARGRFVPVHGNPHPRQWLDGEAGLGLVDFDGLALGEPELDAAAVVAALEFEDPARVPVARLREAFLEGYREGGGSLDERLTAIHRAHRRLAKAVRVATSLRPDGDARAARHLRRALAELDEAVAA
jgi:aminoglycoside phosphotransferase (APT) family kinase protein